MWIKGLSGRKAWVNINHITHLEIHISKYATDNKNKTHDVVAYLDAIKSEHKIKSEHNITESGTHIVPDQVFVTVKHGTEKQCERFIKWTLRWQAISQWIGYLVAGGLGAVLAVLLAWYLQQLNKP